MSFVQQSHYIEKVIQRKLFINNRNGNIVIQSMIFILNQHLIRNARLYQNINLYLEFN